ncbi:ubiquinol oxidase subunit II [Marinimicrobium sp. ARAG 43.8]|uniref:ubiquinol oxidase subunit II n=1 Tax=Marinimicrobium sp. ARAG 43.8 TaxID=3418719 RepID=UPI003CF2791B
MLVRSLRNAALAIATCLVAGCQGGVLDPKGQVGVDEKYLIIVSTLLMLLVVIPVIVMTLYFAWKYREGRDGEIYAPKWAHSTRIETTIWLVPVAIIVVLGGITWYSTHALDPYKPLEHPSEPLTVEVVSLDWKWLFIYPEQNLASVNEVVFPVDVPVRFKITSESNMNSFFIPQLGSQIYSMTGMATEVNLIANEAGSYQGISANFSGEGFSDMQFRAIATDKAGFNQWVASVKETGESLSKARYRMLAHPSEDHPIEHFGSVSDGLFHEIVDRYMKNYNDWNRDRHMEHGSHSGDRSHDNSATHKHPAAARGTDNAEEA